MLRQLHLHPYGPHEDLVLDRLPTLSLWMGPDVLRKNAVLQAMCLPGYGLRAGSALPTIPEGRLEAVYEFDDLAHPLRVRVEVTQESGYATEVSLDTETASSIVPAWKVLVRPRPLPGVPPEARKVAFLSALRTLSPDRYLPRWLERWIRPHSVAVEPGLLLILDRPEAALEGRGASPLARFILSETRRGVQIALTDASPKLVETLLRGMGPERTKPSADVFEFDGPGSGAGFRRYSLEEYAQVQSSTFPYTS